MHTEQNLMNAAWVRAMLEAEEHLSGARTVILEVAYGKQPGSGMEGCIPGAVSVHPSYFESFTDAVHYCPNYAHPGHAKLLPPPQLEKAVTALGITRESTVIVYGAGRLIPMTAARVAWALMYAGVRDVRILDGGYAAWMEGGNPVVKNPSDAAPAGSFGAAAPGGAGYLATADDVAAVVEGRDPRALLVDVRSKGEFQGANKNAYRFFSKAGHIPGALWMGDWTGLVELPENRYTNLITLKDRWKALGITPDREIIFYCGTGWRSAVAFFLAHAMGYGSVKNYDGGFFDWSWEPSRPVRTVDIGERASPALP